MLRIILPLKDIRRLTKTLNNGVQTIHPDFKVAFGSLVLGVCRLVHEWTEQVPEL